MDGYMCDLMALILFKCIFILISVNFFVLSIKFCRSYIRYKHVSYGDKDLFYRSFVGSFAYPIFICVALNRFDWIICKIITMLISLLAFIFNVFIWNIMKKIEKILTFINAIIRYELSVDIVSFY